MESLTNLVKPFISMNDACIAILVKAKYDVIDECLEILTSYLKQDIRLQDLRNFYGRVLAFPKFFPVNLLSNFDQHLSDIEKSCLNAKKIYLKPDIKLCIVCDNNLTNSEASHDQGRVYFYAKESKPAMLKSLKCNRCNTKHHLSFYVTKNGDRNFYDDALVHKYVTFSNETVFEVILLKCLTLDIMYKHSSFKNFCAAYNALLEHDLKDESRFCLIDKRLCEGWFYYNYLLFKPFLMNSGKFTKDPLVQDLDETIKLMKKHLFSHFVSKWSSHKCDNNMCSRALNIDCNHKVNRLTCIYDRIYLNSPEISSWFFKT